MNSEPSPSPAAQTTSQLNIKFGEVPASNAPFVLTLAADYNSAKIENKRFNSSEYLGSQIPQNSILIEVEAKSDAEQLAQKIREIIDKLEDIKQHIEDKTLVIKVVGKENKVYILLQVQSISESMQKFNKKVNEEHFLPVEERWLDIKMSSGNKLSQMKELIEKKGEFGTFFDSLLVNVRFHKTENIKQVVKQILKPGMGQEVSDSIVNSFDFANLDLQFESASSLENYPQAMKNLKTIKLNDDFNKIKPLLGNKLQIYLFGKPVCFVLNVMAEQLYLVLDILFA